MLPKCDIAILSGSVTRGEQTETSDLDIIIIEQEQSAYRQSVIKFDWKIEVFVYDTKSYQSFFVSDINRARPSLLRMIAEGILLKNHPELERIREEANNLLQNGPAKWDDKAFEMSHYFLSDVLDDFIDSNNKYELICIAGNLLERLHEFILRTNNQWIGSSKWIYRELKRFDIELADKVLSSFNHFYKTGDMNQVIELVNLLLEPYGGQKFEGFKLGNT